tara:strand:+ start:420 stop:827 length:408 start_codon:yes stop_codon:yes gene_type:complete
MLELLNQCWNLASGLILAVWGVLVLVMIFLWEVLVHLHLEMPRLEGLLVGILLAWLLSRRDKHPALRVLSAPLRLVLEVLDLAWDHVCDFIGDVWSVATGWVQGSLGWLRDRVLGVWSRGLDLLRGLRDRLKRSE